MSKKFTRTLPTTKISYAMVSVMGDGKISGDARTLEVQGENVTDNKTAMKHIRAAEKDNVQNFVVLGMDVTEQGFECAVADFVKIAKPIPAPTAEQIAAKKQRKAARDAKKAGA